MCCFSIICRSKLFSFLQASLLSGPLVASLSILLLNGTISDTVVRYMPITTIISTTLCLLYIAFILPESQRLGTAHEPASRRNVLKVTTSTISYFSPKAAFQKYEMTLLALTLLFYSLIFVSPCPFRETEK